MNLTDIWNNNDIKPILLISNNNTYFLLYAKVGAWFLGSLVSLNSDGGYSFLGAAVFNGNDNIWSLV